MATGWIALCLIALGASVVSVGAAVASKRHARRTFVDRPRTAVADSVRYLSDAYGLSIESLSAAWERCASILGIDPELLRATDRLFGDVAFHNMLDPRSDAIEDLEQVVNQHIRDEGLRDRGDIATIGDVVVLLATHRRTGVVPAAGA